MARDWSEKAPQVLGGLVRGQGRGGEVGWGAEGGEGEGWASGEALGLGSAPSVW